MTIEHFFSTRHFLHGLVVITFFAAIIVGPLDERTGEGQKEKQTDRQKI